MSIDTRLDATPSDIATSAETVGDIKTNVDSAEDDLISARKIIAGDLEGESADAAHRALDDYVTTCEDLVSDLESYRAALDNLSWALSAIKTDLEGIRSRATEGGLELVGETIIRPTDSCSSSGDSPGGGSSPHPGSSCSGTEVGGGESDEKQQKIILYTTLQTDTDDIRSREAEARQAFADACLKITNPIYHTVAGAAGGYFIPSTEGGGPIAAARVGKWGVSRIGDAVELTQAAGLRASGADVARYNYKTMTWRSADQGRHASRWARSKKPKMTQAGGRGTRQWKHALSDRKLGNWRVPASAEGSTGAKVANAAQKVADSKALKYAGRAGTAVSFGVDAYEQWQKDSKDPSMGQGEKVARAATEGTASAAGGWAGAQAGAAIGACVGGPVGAAFGGIVGGIIGSGLAKKGADTVLGWLHR